MPNVQRTSTESIISLTDSERFHYHGTRVDAVTIPRSRNMSEMATLHGSMELGQGRHRRDIPMHPLEAAQAASSSQSPDVAAAIHGEISTGLQARKVTLPSEALSQA
uniref:hypothetical protein n=1 Tax=Actinoplanes sp. DH11 TaxID=2857011 RepID=UPI001E43296B